MGANDDADADGDAPRGSAAAAARSARPADVELGALPREGERCRFCFRRAQRAALCLLWRASLVF
jgi:hypothetical protein